MVSLGIDLSLSNTGCIHLKDGSIVKSQTIKSKPHADKTPITELKRLMHIRDNINTTNVELAVIEGMAFMARNTTALTQLSGLNYMVREYLFHRNIQYVIVTPTQLKKFVSGKGNCQKDLMLLETYKRYGVSFSDDNLCDAYGLARIGEALLEQNTSPLNQKQNEVINQLKTQLWTTKPEPLK